MSKTTAAIIAGLIATLFWGCYEFMPRPATDVVESYDPLSDTWNAEGRMPGARASPACAESGGFIYVSGGKHLKPAHEHSLQRFDPLAGTWEVLAPMSKRRAYHEMVSVGTDLYVLGGSGTTVEVFDTISETWSTAPDMTFSRSSFAAAELARRASTTWKPTIQVWDPGRP
ncbi:MAG: hypothetical protein O7H41_20475 [Planctomycetota bacterium]|nr:hypothetical protein [Planctomycetota bacterium]